MIEANEIFCKIFQKDITEEGYIYFQGREDALVELSRSLVDLSTR